MAEITYLMDSDPGATGYFHEASGYFSARSGNTVVAAPAGQARTLEEVFTDLRTRASGGQVYAVINLVSHATGFSSLQFPISAAHRDDEGGLITSDTLKRALTKAGTDGYPAVLGAPAVTKDTKVVLHGCDVGRDGTFLTMLGQLFGPELTIYAPLRVAVFRHTGATFDYRLARTWSTTYTKDVHTVTDWAPVRTELANKLVAKFKDHGDPAVEATIRCRGAERDGHDTGVVLLLRVDGDRRRPGHARGHRSELHPADRHRRRHHHPAPGDERRLQALGQPRGLGGVDRRPRPGARGRRLDRQRRPVPQDGHLPAEGRLRQPPRARARAGPTA